MKLKLSQLKIKIIVGILLTMLSSQNSAQSVATANDFKKEILYSNQNYTFLSARSLRGLNTATNMLKSSRSVRILNKKKYSMRDVRFCVKNISGVISTENKVFTHLLGLQFQNVTKFYLQFKSPAIIKIVGISQADDWTELILECTIKGKKMFIGFSQVTKKGGVRIVYYDFIDKETIR